MKKAFLLFSIATLGFLKFNLKNHRGFCEAFLQTQDLSFFQEPIDPLILLDLKKTFSYLATGRQCYVFSSEDVPFVLKIINQKSLVSRPLFKKPMAQNNGLKSDLNSYLLSYNELREESGLLALKLGKGFNFPTINLIDPLGVKRSIDLNQIDFMIQKKAVPFSEFETDSFCLNQIKDLIVSRLNKNIKDMDPRIHRNVGFIDGSPIFLDLGSFKKASILLESEKSDEIEKIFNYHKEHLKQKAR